MRRFMENCVRRVYVTVGMLIFVTPSVIGSDWPAFRGPSANGHADAPVLAVEWSETENVKWKTELPYLGWSTPVVMDGRIWVTTATPDGHDFFVICVDAETGEIEFNKKLFHAADPEPLGNNVNCYASPSPVVERGRVYVHFGTYGTACLDTATGKVVWDRRNLHCRHYRGPGTSPVLFENMIILSMDGVDVQYIVALDKKTGRTVWKTDRSTVWTDLDENGQPKRDGDARKAFSTPMIVNVDGKPRMISLGAFMAFGYDPRTGKEIWNIPNESHTPSTSPVFGNGLAFTTTGYRNTELRAIRVDGTDTRVEWKFSGKDVPLMPSPILVDGLLYIVSNNGNVTCLEADTGELVWTERVGGTHMASPICADGHIYFSSVQGETTVIKTGRTFRSVATNTLESGFMASPAVADTALYLRTKTHIYRIEP